MSLTNIGISSEVPRRPFQLSLPWSMLTMQHFNQVVWSFPGDLKRENFLLSIRTFSPRQPVHNYPVVLVYQTSPVLLARGSSRNEVAEENICGMGAFLWHKWPGILKLLMPPGLRFPALGSAITPIGDWQVVNESVYTPEPGFSQLCGIE